MSTVARAEVLGEVRNALLDVISSCEQGFDDQDEALIRLAFHDDAILDLGNLFGRQVGLDAILATANEFTVRAPYMHHRVADPLLQIDLVAGTATGSTGIDCLCTVDGRDTLHCGGRYEDLFERIDGRWAISERRYEADFMTPTPDRDSAADTDTEPAGVG